MNYSELLALAYFRIAEREYDLAELQQLIGANDEQLASIVLSLLHTGLLNYQDRMIAVTETGLTVLVDNGMLGYDYRTTDENTAISPRSCDEIYYPERFIKRYSTVETRYYIE